MLVLLTSLTRGGAVVARRAHNPKVRGSNPLPATKNQSGLPRQAALQFAGVAQWLERATHNR